MREIIAGTCICVGGCIYVCLHRSICVHILAHYRAHIFPNSILNHFHSHSSSNTHNVHTHSAPWIFRKIYDGSPTVLGGTCHLGQLVNEGFEQEAANGEALGRAYIGAGPLKLFATPHLGGVKAEAIYLRSDDDPSFRTEMSGEFLLRGMFNTQREITLLWHTGDFALDEIAPNPAVCPALSSVGQDAMASREWLQYNESDWVKDLDRRMEEELPGYKWEHMLDCLGTTSCTNRPFPSTLTKETLADAFQHGAMLKAFKFAWNDAYYSKLGIGPFMKELLDNMRARVQGSSALRFGLFLGHDTSVLPLLAALGVWEGVWPPYSSLLVFELYEGEGDQYFFRLVYDGKELIMDECDGKALCRVEVLEQVVTPWALATGDPRRACAVVTEEFDYEEEEEEDGKGSSIMVHLRAAEAEEKKGGEAGGETNTTTTAPPTAPAPVVNEPTPTTNKSSNKANGGGIGGVHLFLAVFFSLLVGILFGIVMTLSWAERRQRETGNPGPYHHPIGNGSGWGWLDRLSASLRGSSSASYSSV